MSEWVNIDKLGTLGMEPDMMPADRQPQSLDIAVNMRAKGTNLANAGGFGAVPFGTIPDEVVASNCSPCPNIYLSNSLQNGEHTFDRSWNWDWNDQRRYLAPFEINKAGQDYDQTLSIRYGECNDRRLWRIDIEILNTAAARRVKVLRYDQAGALVETHLDHDATTPFSDGNQHWVIVEQYDPGGSNIGYRIWIDNASIADITPPQQYVSRYTSVVRANSPFGLSIPIAFYRFSQTLRDCLTSGNFNGFGRCINLKQPDAFAFDRTLTDVDLDLYHDNRIATPKSGGPLRRTAYLDHGTMSGKVYIEWVRDFASCKADSYFIGGVKRGLSLGTNTPGQVADSWGYTGPTGRLQVDGNPDQDISYLNLIMDRTLIALDFDLNLLYLGGGEAATVTWIGGGTPGAGANSWDFGASGSDMQLVSNFLNATEATCFLSSAESCRHPAPAGFGYLQAP